MSKRSEKRERDDLRLMVLAVMAGAQGEYVDNDESAFLQLESYGNATMAAKTLCECEDKAELEWPFSSEFWHRPVPEIVEALYVGGWRVRI